jgi:hypothetical protein
LSAWSDAVFVACEAVVQLKNMKADIVSMMKGNCFFITLSLLGIIIAGRAANVKFSLQKKPPPVVVVC